MYERLKQFNWYSQQQKKIVKLLICNKFNLILSQIIKIFTLILKFHLKNLFAYYNYTLKELTSIANYW